MFSSCELKLTSQWKRSLLKVHALIVVCDYVTFVNALEWLCVYEGLAIPKHANDSSSDVPGCEGPVRRWPEDTDIIIIIKVCVRTVAETKRNLLCCNDIHFDIHEIMMMAGLHYCLLFPSLSFNYPYWLLYSTLLYVIVHYRRLRRALYWCDLVVHFKLTNIVNVWKVGLSSNQYEAGSKQSGPKYQGILLYCMVSWEPQILCNGSCVIC